ncbi:MAG: hypothetical protein A3H69_02400 [Candidatus Sungbacteria bacterium RIFCSPLOWO2_02_FULL_47_9]|uniref:DUF948 domain-containing protein n=2 Tax=Parcubacteria group TaxID=1794811 RepID=A0A1G2RPW4_9BACT|nr:MAG: hypothetical protein UX72_C0003G0069 [Parcubacteria group bacterium GW2011_GWA2_47_10]OGZ94002.1 MAG: hypothetical protein A2633_00995 [Candidatus Sungbacteria bacterium RIFCSPHIGHO2_01_FULL_47_32]OHA11176.1 MAG: hypothetical protein A3H69_02400 [Candidatus Sungbacteria bacterium RIFCSPLOWO2_02_FULL_47_9]OHA74883.1 MAG: hypothetical protein A3A32_03480 [Candidatus Wildermuthbacteria bacterium RIFCSPLOWO2_01_FULL_48_35]
MNELLHADIFFFVTAIAVVAVATILTVVLVYIIRILNDIKSISKDVKHVSENATVEADRVIQDLGTLREHIREEGMKLKNFANFFTGKYKANKKGRSAHKL